MMEENLSHDRRDPYGPYHLAMRPEVMSGYLKEAHRQRAECAATLLRGCVRGVAVAGAWVVRHLRATSTSALSGHRSVSAHH